MRLSRILSCLIVCMLIISGLTGCGGYGGNKDANLNRDKPKTPDKTIQ